LTVQRLKGSKVQGSGFRGSEVQGLIERLNRLKALVTTEWAMLVNRPMMLNPKRGTFERRTGNPEPRTGNLEQK
jgi:hypothetical protein